VIGCLDRTIQRPIPYGSVQLARVWFLCWYHFRVWLRSSLPLHPGRLRLLDSSFPLQPGRYGAAMVQRPMCHTLKTLIHTCHQTRSYLVLNQQQKQPCGFRYNRTLNIYFAKTALKSLTLCYYNIWDLNWTFCTQISSKLEIFSINSHIAPKG